MIKEIALCKGSSISGYGIQKER